MENKYTKASFWKCALQVNPYTYIKYRGEEHGLSEDDYNQQILQICKEENIKILGIADHGNVDHVDAIRELMNENDIIVFPGFEICTTEKVHFVCLFPENTSKDQLNRYLGKLDVTNAEDGVRPSNLGGNDLLSKINKLGGFCYAAHATNDSGILMRKSCHVWENMLLRAAQIPSTMDDLENKEKNSYVQILQNKTPAYKREIPIAVINAKDVEQPDTLKDPRASCLIKMTNPSFEAFKLAFQDPASRIRLNSDVAEKFYSKIRSMKITNGYLDGVNIDFSEHLNAVIGGRGTGKSTLLECIRYALDLEPIGKNAINQHNEIIKENIGKSKALIELVVRSSKMHGKEFTISRKYPDSAFVKDENGQISSFTPSELLPEVEIYGQNEIYEIAQDSDLQKKILSRFLQSEYGESDSKIKESLKALSDNRTRLVSAMEKLSVIEEELSRLPKLQERVKQFKSLGIEDKLKIVPLLEREKRLQEKIQHEELKTLKNAVENIDSNLPDTVFLNEKVIENLPHRDILDKIKIKLDEIKTETKTILEKWNSITAPLFSDIESLLSDLSASVKEKEENLETIFKELPESEGKSGREIGLEFQRLLTEIEKIKPKETLAENQQKVVKELRIQRKSILSDLSEHRASRSSYFENSLKEIKKKLKGQLKLTMKPESNPRPLIDFLIDCNLEGVGEKRLSWIQDNDNITPTKLAELINNGVDSLMKAGWNITQSTANAMVKMSNSQILEMEELELPDIIQIELNIASHGEQENYKVLEKLSTGQQCTAILHLLLLQNKDPLIMDQPEDNLDNAFIADRIVSELRSEKLNRQFLFATHNANIPVFGDAEWIGIFESFENKAFMPEESQGAIDVKAVRNKTANILEGGKTAFNQRKEKYGF